MARILVIDDDYQVREMLRLTLELAGYEVEVASDGREGLRLYHDRPTDMIITDIIMPNMDGLEIITELRCNFPETKIIAFSGGGFTLPDYYLRKARKSGAMHTLSKPIRQDELLGAVSKLLNENKVSKAN